MARNKKSDTSKGSPAWMNTYSDLVTLLLCFFALLFSMSSIDIEKFKALISSFDSHIDLMPGGLAVEEGPLITNGITQLDDIALYFLHEGEEGEYESEEVIQEKLAQAKDIAEDLDEYLEAYNIRDQVEITYTAQYVQLSLKGAILFDSARSELKTDALSLIDTLGDVLKKYEDKKIAIEGHTDNLPINTRQFPNNWYLSAARAITVATYLTENKNFSPENVSAIGYGEYRPIASNGTAEGRAENRRVEIKIINTLNAE
jgi:chemotaxis protein MotB